MYGVEAIRTQTSIVVTPKTSLDTIEVIVYTLTDIIRRHLPPSVQAEENVYNFSFEIVNPNERGGYQRIRGSGIIPCDSNWSSEGVVSKMHEVAEEYLENVKTLDYPAKCKYIYLSHSYSCK